MSKVLLLGDWDADGVVSSALVLYAQEVKRIYPLKDKAEVTLKPVDPHIVRYVLAKEDLENYNVVVLLDIPYVKGLGRIFKNIKRECRELKLIYFDHHLSTIYNLHKLRRCVDELIVGYEPTTELVYNKLKNMKISLTPRLEMFSKIVSYMDRGIKVPETMVNTIKLAKAISRMLTLKRDEELWIKIARWLASPLPITTTLGINIADIIRKYSLTEDEEIKEKAIELAVEARNIGYLKFIDARGKWKRRGASALASRIYRMLKKPVVLLIEDSKGNPILIIRAGRKVAAKIAYILSEKGLVKDMGGHANLAIVRIKPYIQYNSLINALREASLRI